MLTPQRQRPVLTRQRVDPAPSPIHRAGPAVTLAVTALLLKLPQAALSLAAPPAVAAHVPPGGSVVGVTIGVAWLGFTVVTLGLHRWVGAFSALWFSIVSGLSGAGFLAGGYMVWGGVQLVTAAVALIAVIVAGALGAFRGSRW